MHEQEASISKLQQVAREHPDMAEVAQSKIEWMRATKKGSCNQQELDAPCITACSGQGAKHHCVVP